MKRDTKDTPWSFHYCLQDNAVIYLWYSTGDIHSFQRVQSTWLWWSCTFFSEWQTDTFLAIERTATDIQWNLERSMEWVIGIIFLSAMQLMMLFQNHRWQRTLPVQEVYHCYFIPLFSTDCLFSFCGRAALPLLWSLHVAYEIMSVWKNGVFHNLLSCQPCAFFPNLYTNLLSTRSKIPVL